MHHNERFSIKEGHFPLLIMRKRGPINIPYILHTARNTEEFLRILKDTFTDRIIFRISQRTKLQSKSSFWFLYRRCVITGTLAKRIITQNQRNEGNEKLNRCITRQFQSNFSNEAMRYGIENEKGALEIFFRIFKSQHRNSKIHIIGLTLYKEYPFIGGSPDAVLTCDCCLNSFLVEIKCPYRLKDTGLENWQILEYFDSDQGLKKSHTYYNQINLYQGILKTETAFFVVYAKGEVIVKMINFNEDFFNFQIENISQYYLNYFLPTVINKNI